MEPSENERRLQCTNFRCVTGDGLKLYQPCWCGDDDNYRKGTFEVIA